MSLDNPINVICIHWGDAYGHQDINTLYSMVVRNTSLPVRFHLFSNSPPEGLNNEIHVHPEPGLDIPSEHNRHNYRKEVGLCDDNLGGLAGERVFFFDLDVVITGNLNELFNYPRGSGFYIINDWNTKGDHVGQASCYSFVVGTLGFVKKSFEEAPLPVLTEYGTASQEYLSAMVIKELGPLNFWPQHWFRSFRYHCLPHPLLRWFKTPKKPGSETKVLAFHGHPDIQDAIEGRWGRPGDRKQARGWKKIYKHCKPTAWILDYWNTGEKHAKKQAI